MKRNPAFMLYLIGLSMLGYLATDMYLPAFGTMQQQLNLSANAISASLSIFLAGFAAAQLIWGPLSDRFGRKPILVMGLSMFSFGCLGMLWVTDQTMLLVLRFIQAIGVCSAAVIWQALVIDRYRESNRIFATIMPLVALSPALAPLLGAAVINHFSWRVIFAILFAIGAALVLATLFIRESKSKEQRKAPKSNISFFKMLSSPIYSGNVLIYSVCSASFFAWLTGSPFILSKMGYSPADIGFSYMPQTLAFLVGGFGCRQALNRFTSKQIIPILLGIYAFSIIAFYLVATQTEATLTTLLIPFCVMAIANGGSYPLIVAEALEPFAEHSGKAAALQNTLQLGLCFIASLLVSTYIDDALYTTASIMLATVPLSMLGYLMGKSARKSLAKQ